MESTANLRSRRNPFGPIHQAPPHWWCERGRVMRRGSRSRGALASARTRAYWLVASRGKLASRNAAESVAQGSVRFRTGNPRWIVRTVDAGLARRQALQTSKTTALVPQQEPVASSPSEAASDVWSGGNVRVHASDSGAGSPVPTEPAQTRALGAVVDVLAASPRRDQPGTRIEDHAALVAVVGRERLAQALDGTSRLAVAQAREGRARVLKPPDERERGVEVVAVEDRLVDVLEAHPVEAGALEDARGGVGIAERERVRARLRWLRRVAQRRVDRPRPFVVLASLPDDHHQARLGSKGNGNVGERGGRIGEKHRPEAADRHVEAGRVEAMHLGVGQLVPDVVEPFGRRQLTGALKHALGHVDADNAAGLGLARRLASRQPGSAADVDHLVTGADPVGAAKVLVVGAQLGVVEVQAVRRGHRLDAN